MIDATRHLRFSVGALFVLFAVVTTIGAVLGVVDGRFPAYRLILVWIGMPVCVTAIVFLARGMFATDPSRSVRLLSIGTVLTVAGWAAVYGAQALPG
ncbi:MAG TPA: hypothetical protein VN408_43525 [Actinoplanes sp.]|nr:hypothetical protein [Actinoplanes sp.]